MALYLSRLMGERSLYEAPRRTPILRLPVELRLQIYEDLIEPVTYTIKPKGRPGILKAYGKTCDMAILCTCKAIHDEAKPAIIKALRMPPGEPAVHFFVNSFPVVEQFIKMNHIRFGLVDFIQDKGLKRLAVRAQHLSESICTIRIDYARHPTTNTLDCQQDLALLEVAAKRNGDVINIVHKERVIPLPEFLADMLDHFSRPPHHEALLRERTKWKLWFDNWSWLWERSRIANLGNGPLPPQIRPPPQQPVAPLLLGMTGLMVFGLLIAYFIWKYSSWAHSYWLFKIVVAPFCLAFYFSFLDWAGVLSRFGL